MHTNYFQCTAVPLAQISASSKLPRPRFAYPAAFWGPPMTDSPPFLSTCSTCCVSFLVRGAGSPWCLCQDLKHHLHGSSSPCPIKATSRPCQPWVGAFSPGHSLWLQCPHHYPAGGLHKAPRSLTVPRVISISQSKPSKAQI